MAVDKNISNAELRAIRMLHTLEYQADQAPSTTRIYPALLGASEQTLALAEAVNAAKDALAKAFKAMQGRRILIDIDGEPVQVDLTRHALASLGKIHLHFHLATRHIVICPHAPYRVGYTWTTGSKRIERTTREQLIRRLHNTRNKRKDIQDHGMEEDLSYLSRQPPYAKFAIKRPPIKHPRANIAWRVPGEDRVERRLRPAMLPILYPAQPGGDLPTITPLSLEPPGDDAPRRVQWPQKGEVRVSDQRVLKTLPVYAYG